MYNPISQLNEHCQKCKLPIPIWQFAELSKTPSSWEATVSLDVYKYTAKRHSKKEAAACAASLLQSRLWEEKIWWTQLFSTPELHEYKRPSQKRSKVWQPH